MMDSQPPTNPEPEPKPSYPGSIFDNVPLRDDSYIFGPNKPRLVLPESHRRTGYLLLAGVVVLVVIVLIVLIATR